MPDVLGLSRSATFAPGWTVVCLGPFEVVGDDGREIALRSGRQRVLLTLLVLRANELMASEVLVEELWRESPPPTALKMEAATS